MRSLAGFVSALGADKTISFNAANVHVIRTADGRKLDDIRTPEDNTWAADCITECVRSFCARDDVRLLVSMAGGRKSMGFYAGYALSLYGRAFDGLYHVLVSPPYENLPDFFYPAQQSPECLNIRNVRLAACDAEIMLPTYHSFAWETILRRTEEAICRPSGKRRTISRCPQHSCSMSPDEPSSPEE